MSEPIDTPTPATTAADPSVLTAPPTGGRSRTSGVPLAMVTVLAGALLAGGNSIGSAVLVGAVGVLQGVLVLAWVLGTGLPGRIGALLMGVGASAAADVVVVHYHQHGYEPVLGVLGVAIPVMFIHQLTRGVVRSRVVESLADITVLLLAVTAAAGLILLRYQGNGQREVLTVVAAMTAGLLVDHLTDLAVPAPRFDPAVDRGLPGVVLGIAAGAAVGIFLLRQDIDFAGGRAAFAGAAIAAVACLLSIGASFAGVHSTLRPVLADPVLADVGPGLDSDASLAAAEADGAALTPVAGSAFDGDFDELPARAGIVRLRPFAAVLVTMALTVPAGYVLMIALSS